ncbi:thiol-disulfide oxidoreductase DCC family protein [Wenyingzhuangia sp. 2_MG-2023]|uniref:thiol-disulfide oxidoreductase DCC family protein n=1 Tax=Wenyingzhuangia sp. 2_MG-2023 TaxID=3062639 RepID=UPI0026E133CE|nr:DCC1-like thiol-disulfide oxidoreductase family protein [Wenyingzhuangia sp. 2_MG-2023]MDO6736928.1 DCC1-like thiol-disulfide oxidoreductase family protein [Wenyingzhuangia sp. 2_MG-2023]
MKKIEDILKKHPIVLFDGVCNLCNTSVQIVIKNDVKNIFKFAPLQNPEVQIYLQNQKEDFNGVDSILLLTPQKIYTKSSAALTIAKNLKGMYALLYVFYLIPKPIRDLVYDFIAKNRYRWYGKQDQCMIPTKALKNKFL